jgi:hypothetical protein
MKIQAIAKTIIVNKIYEIRGKQVMFDFDLSQMYDVETRRLKEQVKRNIGRFPEDFMFQLTKKEWLEVIANCDNLPENVKYSPSAPFAFTQEGVAMLSGILRSPIAVQVNITIMRAFVSVREFLENTNTKRTIAERVMALEWANKELRHDMDNLNDDTKKAFDDLFNAFSQLSDKINKPKAKIGYTRYLDENKQSNNQ